MGYSTNRCCHSNNWYLHICHRNTRSSVRRGANFGIVLDYFEEAVGYVLD
jgi:hypothetical protein